MRTTLSRSTSPVPAMHQNASAIEPSATTSKSEDSAAPYFADGVMAAARATQARLEAANLARRNEPVIFAQAVRNVYEKHPLVSVIQNSLHELSKTHGHARVYRFHGPDLMLTPQGFRKGNGHALGKKVGLGECKTAAAARQTLDAQLAQLAESPDGMVQYAPVAMPDMDYARARSDDSDDGSSSVFSLREQEPQEQRSPRPRARRSHSVLAHLPILGRLFR